MLLPLPKHNTSKRSDSDSELFHEPRRPQSRRGVEHRHDGHSLVLIGDSLGLRDAPLPTEGCEGHRTERQDHPAVRLVLQPLKLGFQIDRTSFDLLGLRRSFVGWPTFDDIADKLYLLA